MRASFLYHVIYANINGPTYYTEEPILKKKKDYIILPNHRVLHCFKSLGNTVAMVWFIKTVNSFDCVYL